MRNVLLIGDGEGDDNGGVGDDNPNTKLLTAKLDDVFKRYTEMCQDFANQSSLFSGDKYKEVEEDIPKLITINKQCLRIEDGYRKFSIVGLGGTFDHLHIGHRLMLTLAVLLGRDKIIIGITEEEMLEGKEFMDRIESYEERKQKVMSYMCSLKNDLASDVLVEIEPLKDRYGPTILLEKMDCIIITPETIDGALEINRIRSSKGFNPLQIFKVDLILLDSSYCSTGDGATGKNKLSSTLIRKNNNKS